MSHREVYLQAIATAVPAYRYSQDDAAFIACEALAADAKGTRLLKRLYRSTHIQSRYSVMAGYGSAAHSEQAGTPLLHGALSTGQRNAIYQREGAALAETVVRRLFTQCPEFNKNSLTHLITVSCTGFSAPGFDLHLMKTLALPQTLERTHIGFMGCHAGFNALKLARSICRSDAKSRVLIVNVELCSLHYQLGWDPDVLLSNALFADGASAVLVTGERKGPAAVRMRLREFHAQILAQGAQAMGWTIGDRGFRMTLSRDIPELLATQVPAVLETFLAKAGISRESIRLWALHPGGKGILDQLARVLHLDATDLSESRAVLRDFGNMSSPTIFFILQRLLAHPDSGIILAMGFGPGLAVEAGIFEKE